MSDRIGKSKKAGLLPETFLAKESVAGTKWAEVTSLAVEPEIQVKVNYFTVIVPVDFNETVFIRVCKALKLC